MRNELSSRTKRLEKELEDLTKESDNLKLTVNKLIHENGRPNLKLTVNKLINENDNLKLTVNKLIQENNNLKLTVNKLINENDNLKLTVNKLINENECLRRLDSSLEISSWEDAARDFIAMKLGISMPDKLEKLIGRLRQQYDLEISHRNDATSEWYHWKTLKDEEESLRNFATSHAINNIVQTYFHLLIKSWSLINSKFYSEISAKFHARRNVTTNEVIELVDFVLPDNKYVELRDALKTLITNFAQLEVDW